MLAHAFNTRQPDLCEFKVSLLYVMISRADSQGSYTKKFCYEGQERNKEALTLSEDLGLIPSTTAIYNFITLVPEDSTLSFVLLRLQTHI